jgi:hypothetical protein
MMPRYPWISRITAPTNTLSPPGTTMKRTTFSQVTGSLRKYRPPIAAITAPTARSHGRVRPRRSGSSTPLRIAAPKKAIGLKASTAQTTQIRYENARASVVETGCRAGSNSSSTRKVASTPIPKARVSRQLPEVRARIAIVTGAIATTVVSTVVRCSRRRASIETGVGAREVRVEGIDGIRWPPCSGSTTGPRLHHPGPARAPVVTRCHPRC